MSWRNIIRMLLSLVMLVYLVVAVSFTGGRAARSPYTRVDIVIDDSARTGFITRADIVRETDSLPVRYPYLSRGRVNTLRLSRHLNGLRNIERASVTALNDGSLLIRVVPMIPVARVFTPDGNQHYVNRQGKRLTASVDYNVDVPVILAPYHGERVLARALPLLDYLKAHPDIDPFVTAITLEARGDIIVSPPMRGHVVNLGDASDIDDKLARLRTFYRDVMPRQGWEYYDTVSVKYRRQIVATRRHKELSEGTVLQAVTNDTIPLEDDIAPDDEAQRALLAAPHHQ